MHKRVVCITNLLRTPYVATASCSVKLQMLFSASSQSFPRRFLVVETYWELFAQALYKMKGSPSLWRLLLYSVCPALQHPNRNEATLWRATSNLWRPQHRFVLVTMFVHSASSLCWFSISCSVVLPLNGIVCPMTLCWSYSCTLAIRCHVGCGWRI